MDASHENGGGIKSPDVGWARRTTKIANTNDTPKFSIGRTAGGENIINNNNNLILPNMNLNNSTSGTGLTDYEKEKLERKKKVEEIKVRMAFRGSGPGSPVGSIDRPDFSRSLNGSDKKVKEMGPKELREELMIILKENESLEEELGKVKASRDQFEAQYKEEVENRAKMREMLEKKVRERLSEESDKVAKRLAEVNIAAEAREAKIRQLEEQLLKATSTDKKTPSILSPRPHSNISPNQPPMPQLINSTANTQNSNSNSETIQNLTSRISELEEMVTLTTNLNSQLTKQLAHFQSQSPSTSSSSSASSIKTLSTAPPITPFLISPFLYSKLLHDRSHALSKLLLLRQSLSSHHHQSSRLRSKLSFLESTFLSELHLSRALYLDLYSDKLPNPTKSGWLTKRGGSIKSWRRRWFVLVDNFLFYYGKGEGGEEPKGVIHLKKGVVVESVAEEDVGKRKFCFRIKDEGIEGEGGGGGKREYYICAERQIEMEVWLEVIGNAVPWYEKDSLVIKMKGEMGK
eukprot:TRINITY_DN3735_c0_g1_i1.p1 TRINITY_DN3735_c0_g1~~TRINITY_DN3735_c0_g1_i1.p1  ORF type:complete len:518 (-),score=190.06 TRINITY_DN3735_c0_g1_i1:142-1695(-)